LKRRDDALLNTVRTIPLFSTLQPDEMKPMIADHQLFIKNYSKEATVYNQNDSCKTLDIVLSGSLVAYSLSENGSAMTMFEFSKDQMLGANLLFGDNHTYPLTIYCMSDARLLHVTRKAICSFLQSYHFAIKFVGMLSHNSQKLNHKITMVSQNSLRENLLEYLRQQSILQSSDTIILPISKKQLADYLGVQRPSLFRELKKLKDEGIIGVSNRTIHLNA
jgi:CRP-like cAMP-binding protein